MLIKSSDFWLLFSFLCCFAALYLFVVLWYCCKHKIKHFCPVTLLYRGRWKRVEWQCRCSLEEREGWYWNIYAEWRTLWYSCAGNRETQWEFGWGWRTPGFERTDTGWAAFTLPNFPSMPQWRWDPTEMTLVQVSRGLCRDLSSQNCV